MKIFRILFKILLFRFSIVYSAIHWLNIILYKLRFRKIHKFSIPVVSIGNLTVGGTGKTPITKKIAQYFLDQGFRPGIVSRGYKRLSKGTVMVCNGKTILSSVEECGDEPYLLAKMLGMKVPIVVSNNKADAIHKIQEDYKVNVVLIDDGFQSFSIKRDIDIVLINRSEPPETYSMLPMGKMREPLSSLSRAHFIGLTKEGPVHSFIDSEIKKHDIKVFDTSTCIYLSRETSGAKLKKISSKIDGSSIVAFCGLADPRSFENSLSKLNLTIVKFIAFPDHHLYLDKDIEKLKKDMKDQSIDFVVTSEKDYYKLPSKFIDQYNIHVLKYEVNIGHADLENIKKSIG